MGRPRKLAASAEPAHTTTEDPSTSSAMQLSPEELAAILELRKQGVTAAPAAKEPNVAVSDLASALIQAIEATRPPSKKTVANRKKGDPWQPKDGSPKLKLKRPCYQHGILINEHQSSNERIELLNKLKPGRYCNNYVVVKKRKDGGLDIDYPVRSAAQRLRLINQFGITSFESFLRRLIDERADPTKYRPIDEDDE